MFLYSFILVQKLLKKKKKKIIFDGTGVRLVAVFRQSDEKMH